MTIHPAVYCLKISTNLDNNPEPPENDLFFYIFFPTIPIQINALRTVNIKFIYFEILSLPQHIEIRTRG